MFSVVKELFRPISKKFNLSILILVSFLGATMGPFGTYEAHSFLHRLIYWSAVSFSSILIGSACYRASRRCAPESRPAIRDLFMVALTVLCFTPPLWLLTRYFAVREPQIAPSFLSMCYYVAAITLCICILRRVIPGLEPVGYFGVRTLPQQPNPRLARRLPPDFEGPILRLCARDHFVDVVSASGIESIRMRLADAIDEMDTIVGHCTHRSHWVVQDAIVGAERSSGKIFLKLTNGDHVPVSRKYRPELEESGILRL